MTSLRLQSLKLADQAHAFRGLTIARMPPVGSATSPMCLGITWMWA
jgi:hypothetical protein